ncbi:MAG: peptide chain release factor N(5)-glutamine methyltransferase [Hyphomicrobiales bacterium]|nr:peptide chain release factor N(5)-glutamine methyltransferase [Hyphomicrobiales bacterium]
MQTAPATVETVFRRLAGTFRQNGIATPALDARLLVCRACGISHEQFVAMPERPVGAPQAALIDEFEQRRLSGEPVSRLVGRREFSGLPFGLGPATLDPRPDTETVVEAVIELARETRAPTSGTLRILDLGTGTGCILLSVLHELESATGVGTDISERAISVAQANASRLKLDRRASFICGRWLDAVKGEFDLVVANPPYIRSDQIAGLEPEVARFDPRVALDGGTDGLEAYRQIIPQLNAVLRPGGWAVFEVGAGEASEVGDIMRANRISLTQSDTRRWRDLSGHIRCVAGRLPKKGG